MTEIELLLARDEITRRLVAYAHAVDDRDWDSLWECYHADATEHRSWYAGDLGGFVRTIEQVLQPYARTTHHLANIQIDLNGPSEATSVSSCVATHQILSESGDTNTFVTIHLRYRDRFTRRDGAWRIASRTSEYDFGYTAPDVPVLAYLAGPP